MFTLNWKVVSGMALASTITISTSSYADNTSIRYGSGSCNYTNGTDTGKSLELYSDVDSLSNAATVGFRYVIEFQKPQAHNSCREMQRIITQRMLLDLEEQQLELELFKARVAQQKLDIKEGAVTTSKRLDDEW